MRRWGPRLALFLGTAGIACGLGIVLSCLPDLGPILSATETGQNPCGDGIIEPDAGEQCDPGPNGGVPGCSKTCQIICDAGRDETGLLPTFFDTQSNHCYFMLGGDGGSFEAAATRCASEGAHVVTLGTAAEANNVSTELVPRPAPSERVWLGVRREAVDSGPIERYQSILDEPGFEISDGAALPLGSPGGCPGCFGPGLLLNSHTDARCVTASLPAGRFATACSVPFRALCEREPPGRRSYACDGPFCFDIQYNAGRPKVTYEWWHKRMTATEAVRRCTADGGTGLPAIFTNPEAREQILYELMHLPRVPDAGVPTDFWVGLTLQETKSGLPVWLWDDDTPQKPYGFEWAEGQPAATKVGARAFAVQTGTSYDEPGATFDTQLLHANDPDPAEVHSVLCQVR